MGNDQRKKNAIPTMVAGRKTVYGPHSGESGNYPETGSQKSERDQRPRASLPRTGLMNSGERLRGIVQVGRMKSYPSDTALGAACFCKRFRSEIRSSW